MWVAGDQYTHTLFGKYLAWGSTFLEAKAKQCEFTALLVLRIEAHSLAGLGL